MSTIIFLLVVIAAIITGLVVYIKHKNKKESGAINNQSGTGSASTEPVMTGSTTLSAELVYWKQYGKEDEHTYNPDDVYNSQLHWWSDYAFEDNIAWPTMGNTSFFLGIRVDNYGKNNAVFGISNSSYHLWIKDDVDNHTVNSGYIRDIKGRTVAGLTIKPKENATFYTELVDIPTLENRNTAKYNIYIGLSTATWKKIGSIILEGSPKANYIK